MRSRGWYLIGWFAAAGLLVGCARDDTAENGSLAAARESPFPDAVRQELVQLGEADQDVRVGMTPERMQDTMFAKRMLRGDSARTARLRTIVGMHGWPDSIRAGREAAQAAFLILQHSPVREFQEQLLPVLEDLAKERAVQRDQVALLVDRVLMHQDLPQRYGTQFTMVDGRLVLHPVEDEAGLDERRVSMGLPSMNEYMRLLEEVYDAPVAKQP